MNAFLPSRYLERVTRLALGIEAIDAQRQERIGHPIRITFDQVPLGLPRPKIWRHNSCVFVLLFEEGVGTTVELRLFDSAEPLWRAETDRRRFVPRRLRIPLLAQNVADSRPWSERARRIALFPGAAYDTSESATGLRGRVERAGVPARWARVQAIHPDSGQTVGRAHCDDRGEFLLLLDPSAAPIGDLSNPLTLNLRAHTPKPPSPPLPDAVKKLDPLWDLPVEVAPAPGAADPVSAGALPWNEWDPAGAPTPVEFDLGRMRRQVPALAV